MKIFYKNKQKTIHQKQIEEIANKQSKGEEQLSTNTIKSTMAQLIRDWEGEVIPLETGEIAYQFTKLQDELNEIESLRSDRQLEKNLGEVIIEANSES